MAFRELSTSVGTLLSLPSTEPMVAYDDNANAIQSEIAPKSAMNILTSPKVQICFNYVLHQARNERIQAAYG